MLPWSLELVRTLYAPLIARVRGLDREQPVVVSVSGLPGTGKSMLSRMLASWLEQRGHLVASFSLDDLYLPLAEREARARSIHPLFVHRGVPGTHDVPRGLDLLARARGATSDTVIHLPRFDKLTDAHFPPAAWPTVRGRPDVIVCDGWFWGARPDAPAALEAPINQREAEEDPDGTWRRAVNRALGIDFPELFACSDFHVHLAAPNQEASVRWRVEQGRHERQARGLDPSGADPTRIAWFLQLFERVGRLPIEFACGVRVQLSEEHLVTHVEEVGAPDR